MKSSFALVFAGLMLMSAQASALCTYITESYGGTIPPKTAIPAKGPFEITSVNGCLNASIDAIVTATGAGNTPEIYIEGEVGGGSWRRLTFSIGSNASWVGPFGKYRVVVYNDDSVPKVYSGSVRYGR
ncbi:hypothetical protein BLL37_16540 [Pseudomonas azotoformans]|uniref:Uncharacterized protein n=1 Tax=Pseudomonas azotoformans TaxID=47878 RepID=A0A1V2JJC7_PSEAZ|nr:MULTISPECIES: hypothetical protein [Pseudomonas]OIN46471.1 hypothetical protein BFL39_22500 [Pseudomonas azotoformans]ONH44926.1 hypothetical protein BLL37_16540 [Pseudomonas azotoformans]SDN09342.1 hypothetical protein SAMN04489799_1054 [Pseudomonas azotoformans]